MLFREPQNHTILLPGAPLSAIVIVSVIRKSSISQRHSSWKFLLGLLCLALVVLGSTIQVAHTHANGDLSHADCSLCATAHVVAQVVAAPVAMLAAVVVAAVRASTPLLRATRPAVFDLFTRPPPAVSNLA